MKRNPQKYSFRRSGKTPSGRSGKGRVSAPARHRRRY